MIYIDLTNALGSASDRHEVTMSTNCGVFQRDLAFFKREIRRNCLFVYLFIISDQRNIDDRQTTA